MVVSAMGIWLSLQNSAVLRLVHSLTHEILAEVNTAPAVTKMLSSKLPSLCPCTLNMMLPKNKQNKNGSHFLSLNRVPPNQIQFIKKFA